MIHCPFDFQEKAWAFWQKVCKEIYGETLFSFLEEAFVAPEKKEDLKAFYESLKKGKGIRSRLIFLLSYLKEGPTDQHLALAKMVETIHVASLIHDDILDQASQRRGISCAHHLFGTSWAVLSGDFFLVKGLGFLNDIHHKEIASLCHQVLDRLVRAQMQESFLLKAHEKKEGSPDWDLKKLSLLYYRIAGGKTASLFQLVCQGVSCLHGAPPEEHFIWGKIGHFLGLSYQINDDVQEYLKPLEEWMRVGHDFFQSLITYPVLRAFQKGLPLEAWERKRVNEAAGFLRQGAISGQKTAQRYQNKAEALMPGILRGLAGDWVFKG